MAICSAGVGPAVAQDATALARAGMAAIEAGRFGDALDLFDRAAALRPANASLCFGSGIAAFMLGRDDAAQARFSCTLAINPGHLAASTWLGDVHYRAGRLPEAIAVYEAALQKSPQNEELQLKLADWRSELELQSRFRELRSERFTALYETPADEPLARAIVQRLEQTYTRLSATLGVTLRHPITVVLYTREQFRDVTKLAVWSVAAYDGRIRVPIGAIEEPDELDRILSHELAHAVIATIGGRTVPAWLNEGLATFLEPAQAASNAVMPTRTPARKKLSTLHRGFVGFSRSDAEAAYASSALAVGRLVVERGMAAVVALLEDLGRGEPFPDAFARRLGMRYEQFARLAARE